MSKKSQIKYDGYRYRNMPVIIQKKKTQAWHEGKRAGLRLGFIYWGILYITIAILIVIFH